MLTTNQKGTLAEAKVIAAAAELGLGVAVPLDDERYDLILGLPPRPLRVQRNGRPDKGTWPRGSTRVGGVEME